MERKTRYTLWNVYLETFIDGEGEDAEVTLSYGEVGVSFTAAIFENASAAEPMLEPVERIATRFAEVEKESTQSIAVPMGETEHASETEVASETENIPETEAVTEAWTQAEPDAESETDRKAYQVQV